MKFDFNTSNPYSYMRFTDYKIEEINGSLYILPQDNEVNKTRTIYDLFSKIDTALVDLLNIGRMCKYNESENKILMSVLKFVEQYGMLGFMVEASRNQDFVKYNEVFLKEDNVVSKKRTMLYIQYYKYFFPLSDRKTIVASILEREMEMEADPVLKSLLRDDDIGNQFIFSKYYCEKAEWFLTYAKKMYDLFCSTILIMDSNSKFEDMEKAKDLISKFTATGVSYKINMYGFIPEISWQPNSLKQALDLVFGFFICSEKNSIKMCKHCEKIFFTKNLKAEYCSPQCRNQANVYKSRAKSKLEE